MCMICLVIYFILQKMIPGFSSCIYDIQVNHSTEYSYKVQPFLKLRRLTFYNRRYSLFCYKMIPIGEYDL